MAEGADVTPVEWCQHEGVSRINVRPVRSERPSCTPPRIRVTDAGV